MMRYLFASYGWVTNEEDVDNLQVVGIGEGNNPNEAWEKLIEENPDILEQGWKEVPPVVYALSGSPIQMSPKENN